MNLRMSFLPVLNLCFGLSVFITLSTNANAQAAVEFDWQVFDDALIQQVRSIEKFGVELNAVPYQTLRGMKGFSLIADALAVYDPSELSQKQKLAFYINAYNYFAIKILIDNKPVDSIKDLGSFFSPVWNKTVGKINQQEVTLNYIEHEVLRKMQEPRIHFAIVCASVSCPDLRQETYVADTIDAQLDDQVVRFLANQKKGATIDGDELVLSKIFSWFEDDFEAAGGVQAFVARYNKRFAEPADISYLDYDWRVNGL